MIIFELACGQGHRFEGWFASTEDFARQADARMVRCPVCEDAAVTRVPSARVRVGGGDVSSSAVASASAPAATRDTVAGFPQELIAKLREIVRNTENVGRRFPEEARKIHYDEAPVRPIRGQASKEETDALADEGIECASLPSFLTSETH
jgi:hypothetical protein